MEPFHSFFLSHETPTLVKAVYLLATGSANTTTNQTLVIAAEDQMLKTFRYITLSVSLFRLAFPAISAALVLALSSNSGFVSYIIGVLQTRLTAFIAGFSSYSFLDLIDSMSYTSWIVFLIV